MEALTCEGRGSGIESWLRFAVAGAAAAVAVDVQANGQLQLSQGTS